MSTKKLHPNRQLPEEILVQILCRLPVKPLIRFSSVAKRWHSLILSDTQFSQSYFKLASERKTLTQRLLISTDNLLRSLDAETESFADISCSIKNHTFFPNSNLLGSCHGFLFADVVVDRETHNLFLWNPSTRFVRELPNPDFVFAAETEYAEYGFGHGLGYVSSTDDYKIFMAGVVSSGVNKQFVEMFSSKLNSWKRIQFPGHHSLSFFISITIGLGVLTNEALHWPPSYSKDPEEELMIFAFDLAKEEFREVPCPPFNGNDDDVKGMAVKVVLGGGGEFLCFSFTRGRVGVELIEFWVMREYGVRESWNVLFIFNPNVLSQFLGEKLSGCDAVFITEGGTIVFRLRWERHMLVRIEYHKEGKLVCNSPFNVTNGDRYDIIEYDETLLSVPN